MNTCKKKVLVICKETYTYPMNFIKDKLIESGYNVEALFIQASETVLNDYSYTSFVNRNKDIVTHTLNDIAFEYWDTCRQLPSVLDLDHIKYVEGKYCTNLPAGVLLMSEQCFTTQYHHRFYFRDMSDNEKLYWIQLLFKKLEKLIEETKPDRIIDIDNAVIGRSVLKQICEANDIKYVSLESSRYKSIWLQTSTLGRSVDDTFINNYNSNVNKGGIENKFLEEVNNFNQKKTIILEDYKNNNTGKIINDPLHKALKKLLVQLLLLTKEWIKNYKVAGIIKRKPMIASFPYAMIFFSLLFFRERYLFSKYSRIFEEIDGSERYVYFPLHLIPESTTLIKSPFYPNEISVIEAVSKALPFGIKLYVKEHGAMIGERPISWYRKIKRLSNVRLCKMDSFKDPKEWIINSQGVITLSGSAAFEAAMLGKGSIIFGSSFFEVIPNIMKASSFNELPNLIKKLLNDDYSKYKFECACYLKSIYDLGSYIPLLQIIKESEEVVKGKEMLPEFDNNIYELTKLLMND